MPIYEFVCQSCGERFEELMRLSDPDPSACPCGKGQPVRRAPTAPAFRLAGSGWYETDFKKDGDKKRNLAGDRDETKATDGAKTESAKSATTKAQEPKSGSSSASAAAPA